MSDAGHTPTDTLSGACFGRHYAVRGEQRPEFRLPPGWWLLPAVIGGAAGWVALFLAVFW